MAQPRKITLVGASMDIKHLELLHKAKLLSETNQYLPQQEQDEILEAIIDFAFTIEMDDINFSGKNEFGYNFQIAIANGYGFTIDICWENDTIWCFQNHGFIHPNLASTSGEHGKLLIQRIAKLAYQWASGLELD